MECDLGRKQDVMFSQLQNITELFVEEVDEFSAVRARTLCLMDARR